MPTLYDAATLDVTLNRLRKLEAGSKALWGRMDAAQACGHCAAALDVAVGDVVKKQVFIGKILAPFVKKTWLGEKPFERNAPTDPGFLRNGPADFAAERARFAALLERFGRAGPGGAPAGPHSFFGRLTPDEWGRLMWKHADHHLRQFGV